MKYLFFLSVCFSVLLACSKTDDVAQSLNPTTQTATPASKKIDTVFNYTITSPGNINGKQFDLPSLDGVINPNISVYFRRGNPLSGWIKLPIPFALWYVRNGSLITVYIAYGVSGEVSVRIVAAW